MSSYAAVTGLMLALEELLNQRLPTELAGSPVNAKAKLLGSADLRRLSTTSTLGLYLHRLTVDSDARNSYFPAPVGSGQPAQPVLPLNLHFLVISIADDAATEIGMHAWAARELASQAILDASHMSPHDPETRDGDAVRIAPEEMATEDLLRIWEGLGARYFLSSSYVLRTARIGLPIPPAGPPVVTRAFGVGTHP